MAEIVVAGIRNMIKEKASLFFLLSFLLLGCCLVIQFVSVSHYLGEKRSKKLNIDVKKMVTKRMRDLPQAPLANRFVYTQHLMNARAYP